MLTTETIEIDGFPAIRLEGALNVQTSDQFEAVALQALAERPRLALDLSGLSYVSSAGLRVLLKLRRTAAQDPDGAVVLYGVQPSVERILIISGFTRILDIVDTPAEAVRFLRGESGAAGQ